MRRISKSVLVAAATVAAVTSFSHAAIITTPGSDDATIKPAGPRTGTSGKVFFNVEGDANAANASYGVIDFSGASIANAASGPTALSLTLTESNAAFSVAGSVEVFLASDSSANIQPTTSTAPAYASGQTPEGIGSTTAFGTLYDLGALTFTDVASGTPDSFSAVLTPAESAVIAADATSGTTLRLVLTPNTTTTAATFAGVGNTTATTPGPQLSLTTVPEPTSLSMLGLAGTALISRRRRRM